MFDLSKLHQCTFFGFVCLLLVACGGDGRVFEGVSESAQSDDTTTNESTSGSSAVTGDDSTTGGEPTDSSTATNDNSTSDGGDTSVGGTDNSSATAVDNPMADLNNSDLNLSLSWIAPVGNNTVSGSPLISDAELIVTGGNFTEAASAQIKAFDTTGLPQSWPRNPTDNTRRVWAYAEVAGDPNGNIHTLRLDNDAGEQVRIVTRDASGRLLTDYNGGGWQLRSAPSIDANGRIVFTHALNEIAVRDQMGNLQLLTGNGIGTLRTKPAISRANIAYFTVEGDAALVSVNLTTGESTSCLGALPSWSSPAIAGNGTIIFGTTSGRIMACSESMTRLWTYPDDDLDVANAKNCNPMINDGNTDINVSGSPVIGAANDIFVRSNDGFIYALNADGKLLWCHDTGVTRSIDSTAATPILVSSGYLIYVDENGVSALDKTTGELVTRLTESRLLSALSGATATPTITPSGLLVFRVGTNLVAVQTNTSLDTGATWPKWGADLRNSGLTPY